MIRRSSRREARPAPRSAPLLSPHRTPSLPALHCAAHRRSLPLCRRRSPPSSRRGRGVERDGTGEKARWGGGAALRREGQQGRWGGIRGRETGNGRRASRGIRIGVGWDWGERDRKWKNKFLIRGEYRRVEGGRCCGRVDGQIYGRLETSLYHLIM